MSILVIGECLVDLIVSPNGDTAAVPGGGPMNLARTIARLGVPVSLCSGISTDAFGRRISTLLSDDGVNTPVPTRSDLLTTLALAELDADGAATYRFYTEGTAAPDVMPADITVDSEVTVVAIGTLGLVLEPLATTVESVVAELPDHVLLFADPNCRPSTIADDRAYRDRVHRLLARTDVVKVSGDDLAFLSPATPTIDAARELLSYGPRVVLLTDGSSSVQIITRAATRSVPVPPVEVVDTVGAGDSFGGGFLAWWSEAGLGRADLSNDEALRAGVEVAIAVSAITCQRAGANPPKRDEADGTSWAFTTT